MKIISENSDPLLRNGYYIYNNNIHTDRHTIAEEMMILGNPKEVKYYFHDHFFKTLNWEIEPPQSLPELYKERAIQLRDKYDYLVLSFSGGSDSNEVLETFLQNNIFLDEVFVSNWEKAISKVNKKELLQDEYLKFLLEYDLSVVTMLKKIREKSPNTKITLFDSSDFLFNEIKTRKFEMLGMSEKTGTYRGIMVPIPSTVKLVCGYAMNMSIKNANSALILGIEKPIISVDKDNVYFSFSDSGYTYDKLINNKIIDNVYVPEYFYWSPDAPLIPIKQSHVVKRELETDRFFYTQYMITRDEAYKHNKFDKFGLNLWHDFDKILMYKIYTHNNYSWVAGKPRKLSPELYLLSKYDKDLSAIIVGALNESNEYRSRKYANINPIMKKRTIMTDPYKIGKLNLSWKK
jgi:hypothetical protein